MTHFLSIFTFLAKHHLAKQAFVKVSLFWLLSGLLFSGFSFSLLAAPLLQRGAEQQNQTHQNQQSTTILSQESIEPALVNYELYKQIEAMQLEIQGLRGMLEEQNYELERLKKAEKERYADLDRRINEIRLQKSPNVNPVLDPAISDAVNPTISANMDEDLKTYTSAKQRVDSKEYNAAIAEFTLYLEFFPNGKYVPQAHYWMGELYMALAIPEYDNAQKHFETVIKEFPAHPKVPDCLYKVALIHKAQNKKELAKQNFQKLISDFPKSASASLAKTQLETL